MKMNASMLCAPYSLNCFCTVLAFLNSTTYPSKHMGGLGICHQQSCLFPKLEEAGYLLYRLQNNSLIYQLMRLMRIYSALQIGAYHTNHCEDYLLISEVGESRTLCAVMDGCTMATDSYFAATLVGKLLRKIAKEKSYQELYEPAAFNSLDGCLKAIIKDLFAELRHVQNQLMLDERELLTTLVILLLDRKSTQGIVLVIGDGLVGIDGKLHEFDQDNKPDYVGYHLKEDFEAWYSRQQQRVVFDTAKDISITTDGIFTFASPLQHSMQQPIDPVKFLLTDSSDNENGEMLSSKLRLLARAHGLTPTDDFAMVRIIF